MKILRKHLQWRKKIGEKLTADSPLFPSRKNRGDKPLSQQKYSKMLKNIARKADLNGNGKYGTLRAHSLRKFFITQLTNHGVEDKIVNFFIGHKIPDVNRVYWFRRVEELIEELDKRIRELEKTKANLNNCDVRIVISEEEIIELAKLGYDCQPSG